MSSLKANFVYKSLLTASTFLISFITFPYITRTLGVENIGIVNFVDNLTNYFLLFASMGISILGVREIASVAKDKELRSKVFFNLLGLNLLFTTAVLIIYILSIVFIPYLSQYKELLYIGTAKILFTSLLIEWFFSGLEEFRYITIRSIAIKLVYVGAVFIFIKTPNDYVLYFAFTVGSIVLNAVINILYARHFITYKITKLISSHYIKNNLALGIYLLLNSMYSTFNVVFLGFVAGNIQVGYYTTAFKLYSIVLAFFSSFTSVMLPRMNALISQNDKSNFNRLVSHSFSTMYSICIPLILFSTIMASDIIYVIAGKGYEKAVIPMMIIMPTVFMVGLSQILSVQIITPLKKDKILLSASLIGALSGFGLNICLVPHFLSIGTSITLLCSETIVSFVYIIYILHHKIVSFHSNLIVKNLLYSLPSVLVYLLSTNFINNHFLSLVIGGGFGLTLWFLISYNVSNSPIRLIIKNKQLV